MFIYLFKKVIAVITRITRLAVVWHCQVDIEINIFYLFFNICSSYNVVSIYSEWSTAEYHYTQLASMWFPEN